MRSALLSLATPALIATAVAPALGQYVSPRMAQGQHPVTQDQSSVGASIAAGIGLGAAGFLVGGLVASGLASGCTSNDFCQLEAAFYGAAAGGTFGMALGVHLGNRRRGNLALDFLTGAAVWGAGIAIVAASDDETVVAVGLVTIPIVQLATTVAVEQAIGRSRGKPRGVELSVVPGVDGGASFGARVRF